MSDLREKIERMLSKLVRTPIVPIPNDRLRLYAKLEFRNWTGSMKIRSALRILHGAALRGELRNDSTIVESTSGNFGVALAHICRELELKLVAVVDPNVSPYYETIMRNLGADILKVTRRDDTGGYLKTRLEVVADYCRKEASCYWPNQYGNPDNAAAHEETGAEILEQLEAVNYVFVGVSTAGTIAGISRKLKSVRPEIQIIAVDAVGSVIFGSEPRSRCIPGIGSSIVPPLLKSAFIDDVVWVTEDETVQGCHELWHEHDIFAGGSSGSVLTAIRKYFRDKMTSVNPNVLFLCADGGEAYQDKIDLIKRRNDDDSRQRKMEKYVK